MLCSFFFNDTATTEIYTLSLHDALPICYGINSRCCNAPGRGGHGSERRRSEEHTSELQSLAYIVCRLLLEKKKERMNENVDDEKEKDTKNGKNGRDE